ncbi:uncharacterized protein DNG_00470 [Cephalotrichum gorgonifer]|uniref:Uncharacterized protein n=1 Tax=Cephalotrichum gorgonifer TaxID=2041049 RepID=A0AAE8SR85_9PEZI|nr:uncharacterized protein DNG_00470 [Cephalotrichum gorgonifer]
MSDHFAAEMPPYAASHDQEASLATWVMGATMTSLAVGFLLLREDHVDNYLYGPYALFYPATSILSSPGISGTEPDLVARIPLVITLTSLIIWNGPTIASAIASIWPPARTRTQGEPSNRITIGSRSSSGSGSSRSASSLDPHQGVVAFQRTFSWVKESGQPWSQSHFIYRTRSTPDDLDMSISSGSERSISLSDIAPAFWTGSPDQGYTDPTLVYEGSSALAEHTQSLQSHINGFHMSHHGSVRSMSPVYMER